MSTVIECVVDRHLCSGCGVCAGVVPKDCLEMVKTPDGEYVPVPHHCTECGLCVKVCPFAGPSAVELHEAPLGEVMMSYVGHSTVPGERERASSGGIATRLLKSMLEQGLVDGVIAVVPAQRSDRLFEPAILRSSLDLDRAAGTKYYPVEFSGILREIQVRKGEYAIIALPCVITALRMAQEHYSWAAQRIRYLFGLACGHNASMHYTTLLAHMSGVRDDRPSEVQYRNKNKIEMATNFQFVATGRDGRVGRPIAYSKVQEIWSASLLTPEACFTCADLFAANADATFMDAWLPPYYNDPRGTSLVVIRNPKIGAILDAEYAAGRVEISHIAEARVLASQAGALARKRKQQAAGDRAASGVRANRARTNPINLLLTRLSLCHRQWRTRISKRLLSKRGFSRALIIKSLLAYASLLRMSNLSVRVIGKPWLLVGYGTKLVAKLLERSPR